MLHALSETFSGHVMQAARTAWQPSAGKQPAFTPAHTAAAQQQDQPQQPQQQQQQQQVDAENVALQQQLLALGGEVVAMERSMRDVAALNQMFSAQVLHQSEQIEQLYSEVRSLCDAYPASSSCFSAPRSQRGLCVTGSGSEQALKSQGCCVDRIACCTGVRNW